MNNHKSCEGCEYADTPQLGVNCPDGAKQRCWDAPDYIRRNWTPKQPEPPAPPVSFTASDQSRAWESVYGLCRKLGMDKMTDQDAYTGLQAVSEFIRGLAGKRMKEPPAQPEPVHTSCDGCIHYKKDSWGDYICANPIEQPSPTCLRGLAGGVRYNWTPAQPEPPAPVLCETCTNEGGLPCPMGNDYRGNVKVCASYEPKPTQPEPPAPCPQCNHPAHDNDCGVESLTAQPKPPAPDHIADTRKKVSDAPEGHGKGVWFQTFINDKWERYGEYIKGETIKAMMVDGVEFGRKGTSISEDCRNFCLFSKLVRRLAEWSRKYPRVMPLSKNEELDRELSSIEDEARRLCQEAKGA